MYSAFLFLGTKLRKSNRFSLSIDDVIDDDDFFQLTDDDGVDEADESDVGGEEFEPEIEEDDFFTVDDDRKYLYNV